MKQAIILAAGRGARLGGEDNGRAKCLADIGGRALILRQIDALSGVGVERFFVVVGHEREDVCAALDERCRPIVNEQFLETNSLYSLWLALREVRGPFVVVNGDVLAHPEIYRRVVTTEGAALAYDSTSGAEDEHMKVNFRRGRLREISKSLGADATDGENVGILRFDELSGKKLFAEADAIVSGGNLKSWAPAAVDRLAQETVVRGIDVSDLPWTEIDFPQDLEFARETVWPAIARSLDPGSAACRCDVADGNGTSNQQRPTMDADGITKTHRPTGRRRAIS